MLVPWGKSYGKPRKESESKVVQSCLTLCDPMDCSLPGSSVHVIFQARVLGCHFPLQGIFLIQGWNPGDSLPSEPPGKSKNTGMGCHALLQGIFQTQGSNPGLPHFRWLLYHLSCQGSPRILEWVAYPFSRGTSQPRNQTGVSCIASIFFTS